MAERTEDQRIKDAKAALKAMEDERRPFEAEIDNIITYVNDGRRRIKDTKSTRGKRTGTEKYDSTATESLNVLQDGLCGHTISRSFRWFSYAVPTKMQFGRATLMRSWNGRRLDELPEVKQWLQDYEEAMYGAFLRSNLYDVVPEIVRDAASIGTVSPVLEEDLVGGRFVVQVPHFRENYIMENGLGEVDTRYRVYEVRVRDLAKKFGLEKMKGLDPNFERKMEQNPFQEMKILHAIYPREDYVSGRLDAKGQKVASCWFLMDPWKFVDESGYQQMPSFTWRWRKNSDELYGRSPIWDAMVEVMIGQQQGRTNLIVGHKMAEPPMVGLEDLRGKVERGPRGWTIVSRMEDAPKPLQEGIQLPYSLELMERTDKKIRAHLQVDFFMMLSQAILQKVEITAAQVYEVSGEKAAILATRVGRMETELMNPLHERGSAIEGRAGRLPPLPQVLLDLSDGDMEIEYLGPFSQIQKRLFQYKGTKAGLEAIAPYLELFPEMKAAINGLRTGKSLMESAGFPVRNFNTDEEAEEILKAQNESAQLESQGPVIAKLLKAIPGLGKKIEEGSSLEELLKGVGGGE